MRLWDALMVRPRNTNRLLDQTLRHLQAAVTELEAEAKQQRETRREGRNDRRTNRA